MSKPVRAALYARVATTGHGRYMGIHLSDPAHIYQKRPASGAQIAAATIQIRCLPRERQAPSRWKPIVGQRS